MNIIFIINGENVPVELDMDEPLCVWRDRALQKSHNTGRPFAEWDVRDERGVRLSPWDTPADRDFANNERVFLCLQMGCGGTMIRKCA